MNFTETQKKALRKISEIAERNNLGIGEIEQALGNKEVLTERKDPKRGRNFIAGLLTYLGGALIVAGYSIYMGIVWGDLSSLPRVILTLGIALGAFVTALALHKDPRYAKSATPVFIFACLSEPGGLFVLLKEYGSGNDALLASVVVFGIMALQCGLAFLTVRRATLLFFTLLYGAIWYGCTLEYLGINEPMLWMAAGITYLYLGCRIHGSGMKAVAPVTLVAGQAMFLSGAYYYLGNTDADILLVTIILSMMVWAMYIGSSTMIITSLLFLVNLTGKYLLYYTGLYDALVFKYTALGAAVSILLAGYWVKGHFGGTLSPLWYFIGSVLLYASGFVIVENSSYDVIFPVLPAIMLYASLRQKSRVLLATAIAALLGFIGYYTSKYFSDVIGWPLVLMGMGAMVIIAGMITYRTSIKFRG